MERIRSILDCLFGASLCDLTAAETFSECTVVANGLVVSTLQPGLLRTHLDRLSGFSWTLLVTLDNQEAPHSVSNRDAATLETFVEGLRFGADLSPKASAKLFVQKPPGDSVAVFHPEAFFRWLASLEVPDALNSFNQLLGERLEVSFVHPTFTSYASTGCFRFLPVRELQPSSAEAVKRRQDLLVARREQVVSDWGTLRLFPDDFRWKDGQGIAAITAIFARLENFLGAVSLADSTTTAENGFVVRVKSHVLREETLSWLKIPPEPDIALRNLFEWCYRGSGAGPLSDKLGLVRNYMSLYWESSIFGQDSRVVAAVRAGFGMYLRRNLKEFVELRAKVAAFVLELDAKATKAVESATGNLEKNLYGVVTFVTSVVLIKALQDRTFSGAFSPQVALLGWTLIGFSALHAVFAYWSTNKELERASELFGDLRKLYDAFFSASDFDTIFGSEVQIVDKGKAIKKNVTPIEKTKTYVRCRLKSVMIVWGTTLLVAASIICYLTDEPKPVSATSPASSVKTPVSGQQSPAAAQK